MKEDNVDEIDRYLQVDPTIELTILESDETLGGTWSKSRIFPELLTQQSLGSYEFADSSVKNDGKLHQPGNFIPSGTFHEYLVEYAKEWNIYDKIKYNVKVTKVARAGDGVQWNVFVEGQDHPMVCDKLIVATGLTSEPNYPTIPTVDFTPLMFHSKFLGTHYEQVISPQVETVSIYGGGKSAYDAAYTAYKAGKRVNWIIRTSGQGAGGFIPHVVLGQDTNAAGFTPVTLMLNPSPWDDGWLSRWLHSGNSRIGYALNWWYARWINEKILGVWGYDDNENMAKLKPKVYERG